MKSNFEEQIEAIEKAATEHIKNVFFEKNVLSIHLNTPVEVPDSSNDSNAMYGKFIYGIKLNEFNVLLGDCGKNDTDVRLQYVDVYVLAKIADQL